MSDELVLGVDLGLSGVRAALMRADGAVVASSSRYPIPTETSQGRFEQDPSAWLQGVEAACIEALATVDKAGVVGFGVSALGPAPVIVDAALNPLTPALLFSLDTRAESQRARLCAQLGLSDADLNHDHAIPKLQWWAEQSPPWWDRAAHALDATGFIVSRLTGVAVMDSITYEDYDLPGAPSPVPIPDPVEATSTVGPLTAEWRERLGLGPDVAVFAGVYDSYGDTAAAGALEDGDACLILGSTLIIGVVQTSPPRELHGLVTAPHLGTGRLVGGWTANGGTALDWARRLLADTPQSPVEVIGSDLAPGAGGLVFLPYLAGERTPVHDPQASGVLLGLSTQSQPAHIYRAVLDGVILSVRDHASRLERAGIRPTRWRVRGGGAANEALVHGLADALGAPLDVTENPGDPVGPCILALRGLGTSVSMKVARTFEPRPERTARYDELYRTYVALYPATREHMHQLRLNAVKPDRGDQ